MNGMITGVSVTWTYNIGGGLCRLASPPLQVPMVTACTGRFAHAIARFRSGSSLVSAVMPGKSITPRDITVMRRQTVHGTARPVRAASGGVRAGGRVAADVEALAVQSDDQSLIGKGP
jgi:hypothetical protein